MGGAPTKNHIPKDKIYRDARAQKIRVQNQIHRRARTNIQIHKQIQARARQYREIQQKQQKRDEQIQTINKLTTENTHTHSQERPKMQTAERLSGQINEGPELRGKTIDVRAFQMVPNVGTLNHFRCVPETRKDSNFRDAELCVLSDHRQEESDGVTRQHCTRTRSCSGRWRPSTRERSSTPLA